MKSYEQLERRCEQEYGGLVDFKEFNEVLQYMLQLLLEFLPLFADLEKVLQNQVGEPIYLVSSNHLDDFLMFRNELSVLILTTRGVARRAILQNRLVTQLEFLAKFTKLTTKKDSCEPSPPLRVVEMSSTANKYWVHEKSDPKKVNT